MKVQAMLNDWICQGCESGLILFVLFGRICAEVRRVAGRWRETTRSCELAAHLIYMKTKEECEKERMPKR